MVNPAEIKRLMKKQGKSDIVANIYYSLMVNCNQQYSEIRKMPIPTVLKFIKKIENEQKEMEKQNKKMKRGKR